jgi:hypothetical protein
MYKKQVSSGLWGDEPEEREFSTKGEVMSVCWLNEADTDR